MTTRRVALLSAWFTATAVAPSGVVYAQGVTATVRVNLPVTNAISVLDVSASSTDFGTVGSAQLSAGQVAAPGPTIRVRSNRPFAVLIAAGAPTFGPAPKPVSDVRWALSSGGSFATLATSPATVFSSASGTDVTETLMFRMLLSLATDVPGLYQLPLSITLTAP